MNEDYLMHFGKKGMKWGVRHERKKADRAQRKSELASMRTDKGPQRFKFMNAANSAARSHYRQLRTSNFKTSQRQARIKSRKEARLTTDQINAGRYRVARARSIKRRSASALIGGAAGATAMAAGVAATAPIAGVAVASLGIAGAAGTVANFATGAHYYTGEKRAYGNVRVKYQNQKKVKK